MIGSLRESNTRGSHDKQIFYVNHKPTLFESFYKILIKLSCYTVTAHCAYDPFPTFSASLCKMPVKNKGKVKREKLLACNIVTEGC